MSSNLMKFQAQYFPNDLDIQLEIMIGKFLAPTGSTIDHCKQAEILHCVTKKQALRLAFHYG